MNNRRILRIKFPGLFLFLRFVFSIPPIDLAKNNAFLARFSTFKFKLNHGSKGDTIQEMDITMLEFFLVPKRKSITTETLTLSAATYGNTTLITFGSQNAETLNEITSNLIVPSKENIELYTVDISKLATFKKFFYTKKLYRNEERVFDFSFVYKAPYFVPEKLPIPLKHGDYLFNSLYAKFSNAKSVFGDKVDKLSHYLEDCVKNEFTFLDPEDFTGIQIEKIAIRILSGEENIIALAKIFGSLTEKEELLYFFKDRIGRRFFILSGISAAMLIIIILALFWYFIKRNREKDAIKIKQVE